MTAGGSQTNRSPFGLASDSKQTDPNGNVDAIASKAAVVIEMRITAGPSRPLSSFSPFATMLRA
jgi:hypothetical protein